jgi:hypothetical protein
MKELIERNRAGALTEINLAITVAREAIRLSRNEHEHEEATHFLDQLHAQRLHDEIRTHHVRIGRGAQ